MLRVKRLLPLKLIIQSAKFSWEKISFSTFTARDFLQADSHGETGTLNTRFVKHIAIEGSKHEEIIHQTIKYADYFPIVNIRSFCNSLNKVPTNQFPRLLIFTYTYRTNGDPHKFAVVINEIDNLCVQRLNEFTYNSLLSMLYSFTFVIPNKITKLEFYRKAMYRLVQEFNKDFYTETFVQVCFYLGMWKKNQESTELMRNFLRSNLKTYLPKLSRINLAIVANAAFKTSTIQADEDFSNRLIEEVLNTDFKDDALLVTLVKSLRLERIRSKKVYEHLKSLLYENKLNDYHFKGLVHIFAYFADGLWNDPTVCEILPVNCMKRIEEIGVDGEVFNDVREKDISTFIWSCAYLRCKSLTTSDLNFIEEVILSRVRNEEYKYCPDELIDSVLSLWMMDYKSNKLISEVLKLNANPKSRKTERVKLDSRLKLLINCVEIENPEWIPSNKLKLSSFDENREAPEYLLKGRENLNKMFECLSENKDKLGIKSIKFISPINDLNIASIKIELDKGQTLFIEVIEKNLVLAFNDEISVLVELKTRLLEKIGYNVIVVKPKDLKDKDDLIEKLKSNLNFESLKANAQENKMINET